MFIITSTTTLDYCLPFYLHGNLKKIEEFLILKKTDHKIATTPNLDERARNNSSITALKLFVSIRLKIKNKDSKCSQRNSSIYRGDGQSKISIIRSPDYSKNEKNKKQKE